MGKNYNICTDMYIESFADFFNYMYRVSYYYYRFDPRILSACSILTCLIFERVWNGMGTSSVSILPTLLVYGLRSPSAIWLQVCIVDRFYVIFPRFSVFIAWLLLLLLLRLPLLLLLVHILLLPYLLLLVLLFLVLLVLIFFYSI